MKSELKTLKRDIVTTAVTTSNDYADTLNANLQEIVKQQFETFTNSIGKVLGSQKELLMLPPPTDDQPNMQ